MNTIKIAFTGGPCGGKSTSIDEFRNLLIKNNINVQMVSETATELLSSGVYPGTNITLLDFQDLLFKIQFIKEYTIEDRCQLLLCDRGLFDGQVYIGKENFDKILLKNGVDRTSIFNTYAGALYFKTIAYEFPEKFKLMRQYETPEVGIDRDKKCYSIWADKIINENCENIMGIEYKQFQLYGYLIKYINSIKEEKFKKLSDYYSKDHLNSIKNDANEILVNCGLTENQEQKVRRLLR